MQYLQAVNKLFEDGLLSHNVITSMESEVIKNIDEGYRFFTKWLDSLLEEGKISVKKWSRQDLNYFSF